MSLKEADRYAVIAQVIERTMGQSDAARWLNISVRQVKRLVRAIRQDARLQGQHLLQRGQALLGVVLNRIPIDMLLNWSANLSQAGRGGLSTSRLAPYCARRRSASSIVSP